MPALTRQQARMIDELAVNKLGIPGLLLMENAGRNTAHVVLEVLEDHLHLIAADAQVCVVAGGGNNGGDGYAIARHLAVTGASVTVLACVALDELEGDARTQADIAERMGLVVDAVGELFPSAVREHMDTAHVVVDALLGTGFHGQVREPMVPLIGAVNEAHTRGIKVVSVDVPSGLDCDTGQSGGIAVEADVTVTFVAPKIGFEAEGAEAYTGQVVVVDIGCPQWLVGEVIEPG
ncbi:MAG: NAD(P)H-hydrate epimerase [Phycisphaera sp.]|nr:NAD(P)H-hydrate epimerase [Phycisphaera sp.]